MVRINPTLVRFMLGSIT